MEDSNKFTAGPWTHNQTIKADLWGLDSDWEAVVSVGSPDNTGNAICIVYMGGPGAIHATEEAVNANARLIAAAPDLLEALKEVTQILDMVLGVSGGYPPGADGPAAKARAAISKALGN